MTNTGIITVGKHIIDASQNSLQYGGSTVYLGPLRATLLSYLCVNLNTVVSRDDLATHVWGRQVSDHTINQHISQLRKLVSSISDEELSISTIPKKGYIARGANGQQKPTMALAAEQQGAEIAQSRVLFMACDATSRLVIEQQLNESQVCHFDVVSSHAQLRHFLVSYEYDLVMLDLVDEQDPTLELVKQIRLGKTSARADIPVVLSHTGESKALQGYRHLMDLQGLLIKPFDTLDLEREISMAINAPVRLRPAVAYELVPTRFDHVQAA